MIGNDWDLILQDYFESEEYLITKSKVDSAYKVAECYPPYDMIFSAFKDCPFEKTKVVIIGQDPYYSGFMADGHAFSVQIEKLPPSLKNIFKAVKNDYPNCVFESGSLVEWAKQGVLLLNTILTVQKGQALSHKDFGWQTLTSLAIDKLNQKGNVVFLIWGGPAKKIMDCYQKKANNLYLYAPHPSPLSCYKGFLDCGHFKKCNDFLKKNNMTEIDFSVREKYEKNIF